MKKTGKKMAKKPAANPEKSPPLKEEVKLEIPKPKKEYECFICRETWKGEGGLLLMREEVAMSGICLGEKLQEVLTKEDKSLVILVSPTDQICWACGMMLNDVDKLEHQLDKKRERIVETLLAGRKPVEKYPAKEKEDSEPTNQLTETLGSINGLTRGMPEKQNGLNGEKIKHSQKEDDTPFTKPKPPKPLMSMDPCVLKPKSEKSYPCRFCVNVYGNEPALLSHMLVKHPPKYLCHICDSSFSNETRYKGHLALHLQPVGQMKKKEKKRCDTCGLIRVTRHVCKVKCVRCATCKKERYVELDFPKDKEATFQCKECTVGPLIPPKLTPLTKEEIESRQEEARRRAEKKDLPKTTQEPVAPAPLPPVTITPAPAIPASPTLPSPILATPVGEETNFSCGDCNQNIKLFEVDTHVCFLSNGIASPPHQADLVVGAQLELPVEEHVDIVMELETPQEVEELSHQSPPSQPPLDDGPLLRTMAEPTSQVRCKTCNTVFRSLDVLKEHWRQSGHPWQVETYYEKFNKIIDKRRNVQKTFKVVKQKFNIKTAVPSETSTPTTSELPNQITSDLPKPTDDYTKYFHYKWRSKGGALVENGRCLSCGTCRVGFLNYDLLRRHAECTGHSLTPPGPLCYLCNTSHSDRGSLLSHLITHCQGTDKTICPHCHNQLNKREMQEHLNIDREILAVANMTSLQYKCMKCNLRFSSKPGLWLHSKCHDRAFPCSICGRVFKDTSLLAVHRRKHVRARPYQCPWCPRAYSVPATLRRHTYKSHPVAMALRPFP